MNITSINISLDSNLFIIIVGILVFAGYTYFIYKYTIPVISKTLKYFLIVLRSLTFAVLFLLLFDPVLVLTSEETSPPINYFFIDNSASMVQQDSIKNSSILKEVVNKIESNLTDETKIFPFGGSVKELENNSADLLTFSEKFTNFDKITDFIERSKENIGNVIFLSDGIITTGSNPVKRIETRTIPYSVIGFGDSTKHNDISVGSILTNNFIYSGKETTVSAVILNNGFSGKTVQVDLFENNMMLSRQNIELNPSGVNRINFNYTPATPGEKKITVNVSPLPQEFLNNNNGKTVYRNILNSKIKIVLASDSPSSDFSFIKNVIDQDENYEVIPIVSVSKNLALDSNNPAQIDSADIFILIGFPTSITSPELLNKISNAILQRQKAFFILLTKKTDLNKLSPLAGILPFVASQNPANYERAQIEIVDKFNPLIQINGKYNDEEWSNLPPVVALISKFDARKESEIVAKIKLKNISTDIPLLLTRSVGKSRSVALLGYEIWRWKLQNKNSAIFDQFIRNIILWLNVDPEADRFKLSSTKRNYALGEEIEFRGEIYDEKLLPIIDAELSVELSNGESREEVYLSIDDNGFYTGRTSAKLLGDISYKAKAELNGNVVAEKTGKLTVENINPELINLTMDKNLLKEIAFTSGGQYYDVSQINNLVEKINKNNSTKNIIKTFRDEYTLRSEELLLIIVILLLSIEWFFRKRSGML
ncbi:MAG: hypothetical protein CVV23_03910 [Ignavibacteriae bacterium HGW-Ignavibacteriae-2]|nr:MAG: hypothetical protein CVV23_03910 [Ignavibacteriae bacterium HGW-Ignavibacteriae-2]